MGESRPDTKGRGGLFIESDEIGYNCFNCGFKFRQGPNDDFHFKTKKFMELLGVSQVDINRIQLEFMKNNYANGLLGDLVEHKSKSNTIQYSSNSLNFKECNLPANTHYLKDILMDSSPDSDAFKAYNYAQQRGIENWPYLMWCSQTKHKLNKRLIIPYYHGEKVVGYTARAFIDNIAKDERYYSYTPNNNYVFNVDSIFKKRQYLIINESPIDSLLFDGVATMTFSPNKQQVDLINSSNATKILVPDLNNESGKKFIETAVDQNWNVFFPDWDSNMDLGEATIYYGKLFVISQIINKSISSAMKIRVKEKLY
ncbi:hypothetical protein PBI_SCTP2_154 [Salicola phage SCTP-2]|nr:hypothetical protein PBI_SCTP2_154 [Salicola phage SCTP-2]